MYCIRAIGCLFGAKEKRGAGGGLQMVASLLIRKLSISANLCSIEIICINERKGMLG